MQLISMTDSAVRRIRELNQKESGKIIRLSVKSAGCGGNKYDLGYAEAPGPHDERFERDGALLFLDPMSLVFIAGTEIDWVEDGMSRSFSFKNPNETSRCGCGESFAV